MKRLEGEVLDTLDGLGERADARGLAGTRSTRTSFLGHRDQPARRGDRRPGAVDRLPAMALPHPRPDDAGRAGAAEFPQHRVPRRGAGLGRARSWCADADRQAGDPLGRADQEAPSGHRRVGAGRGRRGCRSTRLIDAAHGEMAGGRFRRRQSAVHRRQGYARGARATATPRRCGTCTAQLPESGGLRHVLVAPRGAAGRGRASRAASASSRPTACRRRSTAGSCRRSSTRTDGISLVFAIPNHPWVDASGCGGGSHRDDGRREGPRAAGATA